MPARDLMLVASDPRSTHATRIASDILTAWPDQAALPAVTRSDFAEITLAEEHARAVHVILADDDMPSAALRVVLDALAAERRPVVVVSTDASALRAQVSGDGCCMIDIAAGASAIAASAYALSCRQPTLERLASDARIAQASTGGISGEMNKIHEELHLASSVQRELLPKQLPAETNGIQFGALYRPATYVSGDIYDISWIDDAHVGFLLADAVGHGVPAALLTMIIARALVRTDRHGTIIEPAEAMSVLNRELVRWSKNGQRFATAVYGVIDVRTRQVRLAGAGHPPPLRLSGSATGTVETEGPLLGVFDEADFDQATFTLDPGQTLLMYSDGFETAFPDPGADEKARKLPTEGYIREFARFGNATVEGGPGVVAEMAALEAALDDQPGSLQQIDDLTAIAVGALANVDVRAAVA